MLDFYLIPSLHGANIMSLITREEGNVPVEVVLLLGHSGCATGLNVHLPEKNKKSCLEFHAICLFFQRGDERGAKAIHDTKPELTVA